MSKGRLSSWWPGLTEGIEVVGPSGLLSQLTKWVLKTALDAEMSDYLGYDKHDPVGRNRGNSRNGIRSKTVLTEIGPVEIEVPRDVEATFTATIVKKRQRRFTGVDQIVLSLSARGLTTGEISVQCTEVYGGACRGRQSPRSPTRCWRSERLDVSATRCGGFLANVGNQCGVGCRRQSTPSGSSPRAAMRPST
jgi:Transposase, Mutator family